MNEVKVESKVEDESRVEGRDIDLTPGERLDIFIEYMHARGMAPSTMRTYQSTVQEYLEFFEKEDPEIVPNARARMIKDVYRTNTDV